MADNTLPDRDLSKPPAPVVEKLNDERRTLLIRTALVGLPVILATVRGRTVFAAGGTASCRASANVSSCQ
jgi:hypothetical protein